MAPNSTDQINEVNFLKDLAQHYRFMYIIPNSKLDAKAQGSWVIMQYPQDMAVYQSRSISNVIYVRLFVQFDITFVWKQITAIA